MHLLQVNSYLYSMCYDRFVFLIYDTRTYAYCVCIYVCTFPRSERLSPLCTQHKIEGNPTVERARQFIISFFIRGCLCSVVSSVLRHSVFFANFIFVTRTMNYLLVLCFVAVGVLAEPNGPKVTDKVSANDFHIAGVRDIFLLTQNCIVHCREYI